MNGRRWRRPGVAVAVQVQPRMHDVDAVAGNVEIAGHEVGVIAAGGDEAVDVAALSRISSRPGRGGLRQASRKMSSPCSVHRIGTRSAV